MEIRKSTKQAKKRILLGMSGGVDSSVSAILLKNAGYEVIGCTMKLWEEPNKHSNQAVLDAKKVCEKLEILHYTFDYQQEFKCHVIDNFLQEYENARTPNPCVQCNKYLKFGCFYQKAKELQCDKIATGHYAKINYSEKYQQKVLQKAEAEKKDQTYFLYTIPKNLLDDIIFPLQEYSEKTKIRQIAKQYGLEIAQKKDSQEICFIPDNQYQKFLNEYGKITFKKEGDIVLTTGEKVGEHQGLTSYTVGQRKGLGVSYKTPLYVVKLEPTKNQVIVGTEDKLYQKELEAIELNWQVFDTIEKPIACYAKIRYRAKEAKAMIYPLEKESVKVVFEEQQRAITPGQSVVFYDEQGIVLGGGKIK